MKKTAIAVLCCMIILGAFVLHVIYADATKVGTISGTPWLSSTPLPVSVSSHSAFGSGSLTFTGSGTSTLNLSGTTSTSVPCAGLVLSCTSAGCLVGSSSSGGTIPLPANVPMQLPIGNVNSVWVSGGSANSVGYGYWK